VSGIAPRDPVADARRARRGFVTFGALAAAALVVAAAILVASRGPEFEYTYTLTFTEDAGHPYTLLLPLPADREVGAACRYLGNGTPARDTSPYGAVLRVQATGDLSLVCSLRTFEPKALSFTTEGFSARGLPAARVFLNASGFAHHPVLDLAFREAGKQWTTTRFLQGDLVDGWTAVEVREVVQPTPAYSAPPPT